MRYQVTTERRPAAGGRETTVYILEEAGGAARAAIWPQAGFNLFGWQARYEDRLLDLIYADSKFFDNGRPTRTGIPVLFPFPNRIRQGRFHWDGKEYQLPLNDSNSQNAIHGFACRRPWRVVAQGADETSAWLTGEFWGAVDAPDSRTHWPADYRLRLTYRLEAHRLRLEALVENPDHNPLPFGLGYHPYLRVPLTAEGQPEDCWIETKAGAMWELKDSLPTGARHAALRAGDLSQPRPFQLLNVDDLLTDLEPLAAPGKEGLLYRGQIEQRSEQIAVRLLTSPAFRELVVFTPAHRQAFCLEPYTCPTDAINLQQQGVDAGLIVLPRDGQWSGVVEMMIASGV
jgi:aldose 1-epimerase